MPNKTKNSVMLYALIQYKFVRFVAHGHDLAKGLTNQQDSHG